MSHAFKGGMQAYQRHKNFLSFFLFYCHQVYSVYLQSLIPQSFPKQQRRNKRLSLAVIPHGTSPFYILDIWCYSECIWYLVIQRCHFSFHLGSVLFLVVASPCHDADAFLCFKVLVPFLFGGNPIQDTVWWSDFCNIIWRCYETSLFTLPGKQTQYLLKKSEFRTIFKRRGTRWGLALRIRYHLGIRSIWRDLFTLGSRIMNRKKSVMLLFLFMHLMTQPQVEYLYL